MIVLDTHIWIWWVHGDAKLSEERRDYLEMNKAAGLGVSVFSCWEVAKLVELGRLTLSDPVETWLEQALDRSGVRLLDLTLRIAVEATQLPPGFHRDPADQIIVATARVLDCPLMTADTQILAYPHVKKAP